MGEVGEKVTYALDVGLNSRRNEMAKCDDVVTLQGEVYVRKDGLEYKKLTALPKVKSVQSPPYPMGKQIYVETVTKYYVGDLTAVTDTELVLERSAWVADTGRFNEFMKTGKPNELEPCDGPVIISRGAVVAVMVSKQVPIEVK